ncbi:hypothetical protein EW026_g6950 [Hermanssonia centrifuga]|uniref:Phenol 2-monooxygenase n=1 Tax=Hermanssonia centrifuga TaxID=98765 RepID=A0A4S4KAD6_9APHY|nr:hypothetical protein EW026_g6950 [Hermanssonia centrifuga]
MPVPLVKESDVDVLVIGAGPAGLMCANGLAKAGINVRIIDQRSHEVMAGQADGIQPRTIEVLQSYDLAERLLREGNQMHMAAFYNPSPNGGIERTGRVADIKATTARYPFAVTLMNLNAKEGQAETEIVHAKFVVGADGAHSWVRKTLGIAMDGEQTDFVWGVVDIVPDTDFPDIRNKSAIHSNNGSCMVIPREGDKVRIYVQLTEKEDVDLRDGRIDKAKIGPEKLMQVARKSFYPYSISTKAFDWWTIYNIGQRVASKFSVDERVFVAGDACHTHSPKAGQGMNASMNDTHNLIWKLAYVLRGWADISLLKTYELERRKYAQELISFDKTFFCIVLWEASFRRPRRGGQPRRVPRSHASNLVIGQRVLPHVFTRAADGRPYELQDLLPADTRFKILVFAGDTTNKDQMQRVNALAEEFVHPNNFYAQFGGEEPSTMFDVLTICSAKKDQVNYTDLPAIFRTHWSKYVYPSLLS